MHEKRRARNKMIACFCSAAKYCLTSCNPLNYRPPGSSVHGISQARILEWVAISSSRDFPNPGQTASPESTALADGFFMTAPPLKPQHSLRIPLILWQLHETYLPRPCYMKAWRTLLFLSDFCQLFIRNMIPILMSMCVCWGKLEQGQFSKPPGSSQTLAGHPTIQLNSDTIYLQMASDSIS